MVWVPRRTPERSRGLCRSGARATSGTRAGATTGILVRAMTIGVETGPIRTPNLDSATRAARASTDQADRATADQGGRATTAQADRATADQEAPADLVVPAGPAVRVRFPQNIKE